MKYILSLSDKDPSKLIDRPSLINYNNSINYNPITGFDSNDKITFYPDEENNGNGYLGYLKAIITASADTTLPVYYTKESWDSEIPDETLTLITGDNTFYFNISIYRIGICEYDRSTLKRKSQNTNITGIILDGTWIDGYRMFDSALNSTYYNVLTKIDLTNWNVRNVNTMRVMLLYCETLNTVGDLSNWDVSNVTNMAYMFNNCLSLTNIGDLSNWNVSNVTNMKAMFLYCYDLTTIGDLSHWIVSNVTDMSYMFNICLSLNIDSDLSKWDTSKVTTMKYMLAFGYNCYDETDNSMNIECYKKTLNKTQFTTTLSIPPIPVGCDTTRILDLVSIS